MKSASNKDKGPSAKLNKNTFGCVPPTVYCTRSLCPGRFLSRRGFCTGGFCLEGLSLRGRPPEQRSSSPTRKEHETRDKDCKERNMGPCSQTGGVIIQRYPPAVNRMTGICKTLPCSRLRSQVVINPKDRNQDSFYAQESSENRGKSQ